MICIYFDGYRPNAWDEDGNTIEVMLNGAPQEGLLFEYIEDYLDQVDGELADPPWSTIGILSGHELEWLRSTDAETGEDVWSPLCIVSDVDECSTCGAIVPEVEMTGGLCGECR